MRTSRTSMPASVALAVCVATLAFGCKPSHEAPAFDAAPPPPVVVDAAPAQLVPMDEDAGSTVDAAVAVVHHPGSGISTNQARAKQCCNALRAEGKSDPMLTAFAAQCDMVAMQMGPTAGGQAPEFAAIRQLLKGHNIPAVCSGL
jgi:hypothetical protein